MLSFAWIPHSSDIVTFCNFFHFNGGCHFQNSEGAILLKLLPSLSQIATKMSFIANYFVRVTPFLISDILKTWQKVKHHQ